MEDIIPKLDRLRAEKRVYLDFQKNEAEMERLDRLVVACEYKKHEDRLNRSGADHDTRLRKMDELKNLSKTTKNEIKKIDEEKNALSEEMKQNSSSSNSIRALENKLKEYSTQSVRLNTKKVLLESSITDEQKTLASLSSQRGEVSFFGFFWPYKIDSNPVV